MSSFLGIILALVVRYPKVDLEELVDQVQHAPLLAVLHGSSTTTQIHK